MTTQRMQPAFLDLDGNGFWVYIENPPSNDRRFSSNFLTYTKTRFSISDQKNLLAGPFPPTLPVRNIVQQVKNMKLPHIVSVIALTIFSGAECFSAASVTRRDVSARDKNPLAVRAPVSTFGYGPTDGPLTWFRLPGSQLCSKGRHQSPILLGSSISQTTRGSLSIDIQSPPKSLKLENIGTGVEVRELNGTLSALGRSWALQNYHFHTPSEHRVDLEYSPIEMHLVFQDASGNLAVLGFLIELSNGKAFDFAQDTLRKVSSISQPGSETEIGPLNFREIVSFVRQTTFYQYDGSLTTPPCSEGVKWFVSTEKVFLDVKTYNDLKAVVNYNSRIIQNAPGQPNVLANCV